ncbi:RsmB/NOP family class I SAM-dependent RNA methyltransferase [Maribius pontilimi]|uniref:RsmB/NOP family class I SAM-dependent RNA methyltransferase n=1 Tax=Palleronia pontilimi TaxID=1964209 RepID=A0A934ME37_9RHOB|nr:RsmB/NOP family class I SAM-dependent RNA methyltransferase [Palleronia pontilimi]MBJ3763036.1 RsmB/NOP family class I SAM-dependent RNA methyltransferase [Palleronia pontilimi]
MTPAARVQTAIECLDLVTRGEPTERVLLRWARDARHAGSKDRAAVRDLVFDVVRRWWSSAALGGGETGRARMLGYLRGIGEDPATLFTGQGYGPATLGEAEIAAGAAPDPLAACDCPPDFAEDLRASLGAEFDPVMELLRSRAPVFLRVNLLKATRDDAQSALATEGIETVPHPLSPTALLVTARPRAVAGSRAFAQGLIELQDAASQALVDALPLAGTRRVLDYCAGGGGKTLAMAGRHRALYHAHDISAARLQPLLARAERAGASVTLRGADELAAEPPYDLVLADAPCSGSGAWRRSPEGKIRLSRADFDALLVQQRAILHAAADKVIAGGVLAYATCSLMRAENDAQVELFLADWPAFRLETVRNWTPLDGGDGFFATILRKGAS